MRAVNLRQPQLVAFACLQQKAQILANAGAAQPAITARRCERHVVGETNDINPGTTVNKDLNSTGLASSKLHVAAKAARHATLCPMTKTQRSGWLQRHRMASRDTD